jgi:hypothetical protein
MKRISFAVVVLVLAAIGWSATASQAQSPPEFLDHYRLLPRLSTLHQTGGIAGFDLRYRLLGKYDFRHGIGWAATASFQNAEIWGSIISDGPTIAIVIDVDEILNLEGLKGEALPVAAPFDVYKFTGETSDGSRVQLFASVIGPWMYVRGGTMAPPGSADYFEYDLRMVARSRPFADFNGDGVVNAADYTVLRNSEGLSGAGTAGADDVTAGAGYADWKEQFGETIPDFAAIDSMMTAAAAGFGAASVVPEPTAIGLAILGGVLLASGQRRTAR